MLVGEPPGGKRAKAVWLKIRSPHLLYTRLRPSGKPHLQDVMAYAFVPEIELMPISHNVPDRFNAVLFKVIKLMPFVIVLVAAWLTRRMLVSSRAIANAIYA